MSLPYPPDSDTVHLHQHHWCSNQSRPFNTVTRTMKSMVIEFLTADGSSPIKIHRRTRIVYVEDSEYVSSVRRWTRRFKSGEKGIDYRAAALQQRV